MFYFCGTFRLSTLLISNMQSYSTNNAYLNVAQLHYNCTTVTHVMVYSTQPSWMAGTVNMHMKFRLIVGLKWLTRPKTVATITYSIHKKKWQPSRTVFIRKIYLIPLFVTVKLPCKNFCLFYKFERDHPVVYYQICIIYYVQSIHNIHQDKMQ